MTTYFSDELDNKPGWVNDGETIVLTVCNPHDEPQKRFHFMSWRDALAWIVFEYNDSEMVEKMVYQIRDEFGDDEWEQEAAKLPEFFQKFCEGGSGAREFGMNIDHIDIELVPKYKLDMDRWLETHSF